MCRRADMPQMCHRPGWRASHNVQTWHIKTCADMAHKTCVNMAHKNMCRHGTQNVQTCRRASHNVQTWHAKTCADMAHKNMCKHGTQNVQMCRRADVPQMCHRRGWCASHNVQTWHTSTCADTARRICRSADIPQMCHRPGWCASHNVQTWHTKTCADMAHKNMCKHGTKNFVQMWHTKILGLARTIYMHRIWPYIWWFPCQKYRTYTVYIGFWPTLKNMCRHGTQNNVQTSHTAFAHAQRRWHTKEMGTIVHKDRIRYSK